MGTNTHLIPYINDQSGRVACLPASGLQAAEKKWPGTHVFPVSCPAPPFTRHLFFLFFFSAREGGGQREGGFCPGQMCHEDEAWLVDPFSVPLPHPLSLGSSQVEQSHDSVLQVAEKSRGQTSYRKGLPLVWWSSNAVFPDAVQHGNPVALSQDIYYTYIV